MQIFYTDTEFFHIVRQIFSHSFGQGCNQNLMLLCRLFIHFSDQIINLSLYRPDYHLRIKQTGWPDNLLCTEQLMLIFIRIWCRGNKKHLINFTLKLFKIQRSVIFCRRKPESVINKR